MLDALYTELTQVVSVPGQLRLVYSVSYTIYGSTIYKKCGHFQTTKSDYGY